MLHWRRFVQVCTCSSCQPVTKSATSSKVKQDLLMTTQPTFDACEVYYALYNGKSLLLRCIQHFRLYLFNIKYNLLIPGTKHSLVIFGKMK